MFLWPAPRLCIRLVSLCLLAALLASTSHGKLPCDVTAAPIDRVAKWFSGPTLAPCREHLLANKVDVLTLLALTSEEIESNFLLPLSPTGANSTAKKIDYGDDRRLCVRSVSRVASALRRHCACATPVVDFWSALREENRRTWFGGSLLLFTPRIGYLYAFFADEQLLRVIHNSSPVLQPLFPKVLAPLMMLVCPDIYFAIAVLSYFPCNFVLVACVVQHYLVQAYEELTIAWLLWRREDMFLPGTSLFQKVATFVPWWHFIPVTAFVTDWVGVPLLFQQAAVGMFVLQSGYVSVTLLAERFGQENKK